MNVSILIKAEFYDRRINQKKLGEVYVVAYFKWIQTKVSSISDQPWQVKLVGVGRLGNISKHQPA